MVEHMDFYGGIIQGPSKQRTKEPRVFDWAKAAELIKIHNITDAKAGLKEDWTYTSGDILINGKRPNKNDVYLFLGSEWATPILMDMGTHKEYECWRYEETGKFEDWWPEDGV